MNKIGALERRVIREKQARKNAEAILEDKALELFHANEHLRKLNENLEKEVEERTKELTDSEIKYRQLIENMELGLIEIDNEGVITRVYDGFCAMTDYKSEDLEGKKASEVLLTRAYQDLFEQQARDRVTGNIGAYEAQIITNSQDCIWVLVSGAPVYSPQGELVGSLGIFYDITSQKKLQQELVEAKQIAEAAQEAEKQFLANMSHEIRTPLNAIIGMTHLLYDTILSEEQKDYLSILKSSADILLGLISDILDFSKIEAGEFEVNLKEIDISGVVRALEKTFQLRVENKPVEVVTYIDPQLTTTVIGDDLMLNQILINLLGNAVKFTKEGEVGIAVRILKKEEETYHLRFDVHDTGIGIPQEKLDSIFESFKQVSADIKNKFGGTGLGLAITKRLVEIQGGEIWVESTLGKGTTFSFTIAYEDTGRRAVISNNELTKVTHMEVKARKILVVEDNYMNRKYISTLLQKWEVDFEMANNGRIGVEMAGKQKYDLVFMDIQMPEMNGYEATIAIRNTKNPNQDTPIIALTASALIKEKIKAAEVGMNDFLPKPFKPIQLLEKINEFAKSPKSDDMESNTNGSFQFNERLDHEHLLDFYEGDLEHAHDMFEIFLDFTVDEVKPLHSIFQTQDWTELRQLAHKVKPAFSMVGLTDLHNQLAKLEELAETSPEPAEMERIIKLVESELAACVPLLEEEKERMTAHF